MMITRDERLLRQAPEKALPGIVREFRAGLPRLERLHRYAQGKHDILLRARAEGLPNARLVHGFARYISQVSAAYLMGEPVRYSAGDKKGKEGVAALCRLYRQAGADSADSDLALQQSIYGRGVSLCYRGREGHVKVTALDPRGAFVVYDDTVERRPLMGLMLRPLSDAQGRHTGGEVTVYTDTRCLSYPCGRQWDIQGPARAAPHPFLRVPMVEYINDFTAQGDFEELLPLIDAYDLLNSDRLNDRAQFADALLVLTGVMGLSTAGDPMDQRLASSASSRTVP